MRKFIIVVCKEHESQVWPKLRGFKLEADLMLTLNVAATKLALHTLTAQGAEVGAVIMEEPVKCRLADQIKAFQKEKPNLCVITVASDNEKNAAVYREAGAVFQVDLDHLKRNFVQGVLNFSS